MSSFEGRMNEYVDISIDRFDKHNLNSSVYFLSHAHKDHMVGLHSGSFRYRLESNCHIKLYCSEMTRSILLARKEYTGPLSSLVALPQDANVIQVPDPITGQVKYELTVTLIQAGHCPGSVMFLFEGPEGTSLYTGDFRLNREQITDMPHLKSGESVKQVDSLYIDTTFCIPQAFYIPSREDSVEAIITAARDWITQGPQYMVVLNRRAALGHEHIFQSVWQALGMKVHVKPAQFREYQQMCDLSCFMTPDPSETQIHACGWKSYWNSVQLPCKYVPLEASQVEVRSITASTMWFTQHTHIDVHLVKGTTRSYRACYCFHPSYSEVRDVIMYLKPKKAYPNVIPMGCTKVRVQERLNQFVKLAHNTPTTPRSVKYQPLGILKKKRQRKKRDKSMHINASQSSSEGFNFGLEATPEKQATKPKTHTQSEQNSDDMLCFHFTDSENDSPIKKSQEIKQQEMDNEEDNSTDAESENGSHDLYSSDKETDDEDDACYLMPEDDREILAGIKTLDEESYGSYTSYVSDGENGDDEDEYERDDLMDDDDAGKYRECMEVKEDLLKIVPRQSEKQHVNDSEKKEDNRLLPPLDINNCAEDREGRVGEGDNMSPDKDRHGNWQEKGRNIEHVDNLKDFCEKDGTTPDTSVKDLETQGLECDSHAAISQQNTCTELRQHLLSDGMRESRKRKKNICESDHDLKSSQHVKQPRHFKEHANSERTAGRTEEDHDGNDDVIILDDDEDELVETSLAGGDQKQKQDLVINGHHGKEIDLIDLTGFDYDSDETRDDNTEDSRLDGFESDGTVDYVCEVSKSGCSQWIKSTNAPKSSQLQSHARSSLEVLSTPQGQEVTMNSQPGETEIDLVSPDSNGSPDFVVNGTPGLRPPSQDDIQYLQTKYAEGSVKAPSVKKTLDLD